MKNNIKRFGVFLISLLFLEIMFSLIIYSFPNIEKLINLVFYNVIIAAFLSVITGIFTKKVNNIITIVIFFIIFLKLIYHLVF